MHHAIWKQRTLGMNIYNFHYIFQFKAEKANGMNVIYPTYRYGNF